MNFVAQLGIGGAAIVAVIWALKALIPVIAATWRNGGDLQRNGNMCKFGNRESVTLHTFEVTQKVGEVLLPELREQTKILREVRDDMRTVARRN